MIFLERIYFKEVERVFCNINEKEQLNMSEDFIRNYIRVMPSFFNYQEEEKSIKPNIIFSKNIDELFKTTPKSLKIHMADGDVEGNDLKRNLKIILPFCNVGWSLYVDFKKDKLEYGIVRKFTGISGFSFVEEIFLTPSSYESTSFVSMTLVSRFELLYRGLRGTESIIDFRFHEESNSKKEIVLEDLTNTFLEKSIHNKDKKVVQAINKLFYLANEKSHGSIILIIDNDCSELPTNLFMDNGVLFNEPIDIVEKLYETVTTEIIGDLITSTEQYYGISGLLFEMINIDGITLLSNDGKVLGFNLFANANKNTNIKKVVGGARKRAYNSLLSSELECIAGVYFQSQDGDVEFKKAGEVFEK